MPDQNKTYQTACNLCFVNCGVTVELGGDDGRQFVKVRGDKEHPVSKGYICNKASRLNYYQNNTARLDSPMRRRDDGSYEAIDWDTAICEVAAGLNKVKREHGGEKIFYYGGGGQGNHLVGASAQSLRSAVGCKYKGSAISQEKTGLAWVLSRMIGNVVHSEMHEAEVVILSGKNPFMSNGMDEARTFLRDMRKDENRCLIVIDPRRSETADFADIHLPVKPGRDAWCMSAIIGHMVQFDLLPKSWLSEHTAGAEQVIERFKQVPVKEYAEFAGLEPELIERVAQRIAAAQSVAIEEDLGIQMSPHSTLVTYLNFLVVLLTGNFAKAGTMGLPPQLVSILPIHRSTLDDTGREIGTKTLPATGAPIISGLYPGACLADEILADSPDRARALIIESSNPIHSLPQSSRLREAMRSLAFSVVVDVAMTETAMEADYVLPASSQYEKWEATFFPRNFPKNIFHLRRPLLSAMPGTLTEQEIHARIIEAMGVFEDGELDELHAAGAEGFEAYQNAFFAALGANPKLNKYLAYVLYRTLGPHLNEGEQSIALLWGLANVFAMKHGTELARAGFEGKDAGTQMFNALRESSTAIVIAETDHESSFAKVPFADNRLQLHIPELLDEIDELDHLEPLIAKTAAYPFLLVAGSRGAYTANCAIRDPRWGKGRNITALSMNPQDGERLKINEGDAVVLETEAGAAEATVAFDDRLQSGSLSIPNGQGMRFLDETGEQLDSGVFANQLTSSKYRDKFIGTPFHKHVPARIRVA